jgi:hypothetical protein
MTKGKIFISSTIYDFSDLRSALKYYLNEYGYEVYMSENSDFPKDSSQNSYDSCLSVIEQCDYFILLIGGRTGGLIKDKNDEIISITRKEYRKAYEIFQKGKIKKLINFVRNDTWVLKEDRAELKKFCENIDNEQTKQIDKPEHVFSFIDEVRRLDEIKSRNKSSPLYAKNNWITTFNDFTDIINCVNVELNIKPSISKLVWISNITEEIKQNFKQIIVNKNQNYSGIQRTVTHIRNKCVEQLKSNNRMEVSLTKDECTLIVGTFIRNLNLKKYVLQHSILEGVYLEYNVVKNVTEANAFYEWVIDLIGEIDYVNNGKDFFEKGFYHLLNITRLGLNSDDTVDVKYEDIVWFIALHDKINNIINISTYLVKSLNQPEKIKSPKLYPFLVANNFNSIDIVSEDHQNYFDKVYGKQVNDDDIEKIFKGINTIV